MMTPRLPLRLHPACAGSPARAISVTVEQNAPGAVRFEFVIDADPATLAIPAPVTPARTDDLWRHTCCEAFIALGGGAYAEFNFSPSGAWAAYHFDGVRSGMRDLALATAPDVVSDTATGVLRVQAKLAFPAPTAAPLALSAVIEDAAGGLGYWALAHPAAAPEFHHPEGFVANIPPVVTS